MKLKPNEVLVLKRCKEGNISHKNFVYPNKGMVEAPDWDNKKEWGGGLHGWTVGFDNYTDINLSGNFVIIKVNKDDGYIELGDKVKFKKGEVILNTPSAGIAHALMLSVYPMMKLHWNVATQGSRSTATQGDGSTATQGDGSTATQGDDSTATQGYDSTATQGDDSTATQGYRSTAKQGSYSTATQGYDSTATQGYRSTAKQGYRSTAKQGSRSTATQGYRSTATQGNRSTATQGNRSTATQGNRSTAKQGKQSVVIQRDCKDMTSIIRFSQNSVAIIYLDDYSAPVIHSQYQYETVYFFSGKEIAKYTDTPEVIKKLADHEIFIFGSNLNGEHAGGAAKLALDKFGAVNKEGEGLFGQSYAFPTLNKDMQKVSKNELEASIDKLIKTANTNTNKIFFLTKVGCGIAGFTEDKMKTMFNRPDMPANIIVPKGWIYSR